MVLTRRTRKQLEEQGREENIVVGSNQSPKIAAENLQSAEKNKNKAKKAAKRLSLAHIENHQTPEKSKEQPLIESEQGLSRPASPPLPMAPPTSPPIYPT
jgi:hypothetical protein